MTPPTPFAMNFLLLATLNFWDGPLTTCPSNSLLCKDCGNRMFIGRSITPKWGGHWAPKSTGRVSRAKQMKLYLCICWPQKMKSIPETFSMGVPRPHGASNNHVSWKLQLVMVTRSYQLRLLGSIGCLAPERDRPVISAQCWTLCSSFEKHSFLGNISVIHKGIACCL